MVKPIFHLSYALYKALILIIDSLIFLLLKEEEEII